MDIVHVSDIHFGRENKVAVELLGEHLAEHCPDLIVISGDLTQTGRRKEFFGALAWVNTLPAPVAMVPGNHDTPALNVLARILGPFRRYRTAFGSRSASNVYGDGMLALAHLNTAHGFQRRIDWSLGKVRRREVDAAQAFFRHHKGAVWKAVACHHPLVDFNNTRVNGKTVGGEQALAAFVDAGVDFVLSGHTHVPGIASFGPSQNPISLVSAGTLSDRTRENRASFNRLTLGTDVAHVIRYGFSENTVREVERHEIAKRGVIEKAL